MTTAPSPPEGLPDGPGVDRLLNGRVLLRQPPRGHRAGTDSILLAAMVPAGAKGFIVDVGAGAGAVGISVAVRVPGPRLALIEDEPAVAALARDNLVLNGLAERSRVFEVDVLVPRARRDAGLADACADIVLTNPPYYDVGHVRASSDPARAHAHVLAPPDAGTKQPPLADWIKACVALLAAGGRLAIIHRPASLLTILAALQGRAGSVTVTPVHSFSGAAASRILVAATKGSRGPTALRPMLVLHEAGGGFTPLAQALHRGERSL